MTKEDAEVNAWNISWEVYPDDNQAQQRYHFRKGYRRALEDVKKEVGQIKDYVEALKIYDGFHSGELAVCDNILQFIDQQSR